MEDGYMKTWEQCCDHFGVNVDRGLSPDQVKRNLDKYGPNGKDIFISDTSETLQFISFQNKLTILESKKRR